MGEFDGKVVLITGAARGQGRNHALRFAEQGADIIACDACAEVGSVPYAMASREDLQATVDLVEATGRRIVAEQVDTRDLAALTALVDRGVQELGRLDVVVANAGIAGTNPIGEMPSQQWQDMIDINLTGVWHTAKASVRHLDGATGGNLILISSIAGLKGLANNAHYAAAKHGVVGMMKALTNELGPTGIRVNTVNPTNVDTDMLFNDAIYRLFMPAEDNPTKDVVTPIMEGMHPMGVPCVEPDDVSNAVLFLASDKARYVTGVSLPVDAGALTQ